MPMTIKAQVLVLAGFIFEGAAKASDATFRF